LAIYIAKNNTETALYLLTIAGVASYNLFVKHLSLSKTFLTSGVSSLPLLFSVVSFNYEKAFLLLPVATSCFILGREWLMDIRDMRGDYVGGIVTIPMLIGPGLTAKLGFLFQILAVMLLIPIVISSQSFWGYLLPFLILISVATLFHLWHYGAGQYQRTVIQYLWLPMLFGVMMLLS
jgi:4-hydroxybenzoate polyprenyltransferase